MKQILKWMFFFSLVLLITKEAAAGVFDNLKPVQIATNLKFTEGPAWHPDNFLVFSDIDGNAIYKWSESKGLETFISSSGNANGIACDKRNEFYVCRHGGRDVAKMSQTGVITPFVTSFKGKKFNSPNDLEISYLGSIFFTDPDFGANTSSRELKFQGLFGISYTKTTEAILLDSTLNKPNGLTFVNDWKTLYVNESSTNTIYTYSISNETNFLYLSKDRKVFLQVKGTGEIDGITSDLFGNIYVAFGDGGVKIFDKDAREVGQVTFPAGERVRNLCFGGKYKNILFVTAGKSLYKVDIRFYGDFVAPGLLAVPTDKSVKFNAVSDKAMSVYIAFGTEPNNLNAQTTTADYPANQPMEITINGLKTNSAYFYQLFYKLNGQSSFKAGTSGSFHTQRSKGEIFSFAVEADPHLDENSNYLTFRNTLQNELKLKPDFLIDLGDNFMTEKFPIVNEYYTEQRNLLYRNFWDNVCQSMPLFIVQGNHDGELGWLGKNQADDVFNMTNSVRKKYYPGPAPDGFYTGNQVVDPFVGYRENYYAWNWGDALFVVIDPYQYTLDKSSDPWHFTLGKIQYDWFRKTLEESRAKFKFVFAHHLLGGDNLGRGGIEKVDYYESGGKNADGTMGFNTNRPGWGKPLHQLMVETGVQIYFHGHDHFYAEQRKDGIVYQELPQPSFPSYTTANNASNYGYLSGTILPCSGHLNIKILGDSARVDYIGGYHIEDAGNGLINGNSRRTYYVSAKSVNTAVNQLIQVKNPVEMKQAGNYIYVKSNHETSGEVKIYALTGQFLGMLHQGSIPYGTSYYRIPDDLQSGLYLLNIQVRDFKATLKIIR